MEPDGLTARSLARTRAGAIYDSRQLNMVTNEITRVGAQSHDHPMPYDRGGGVTLQQKDQKCTLRHKHNLPLREYRSYQRLRMNRPCAVARPDGEPVLPNCVTRAPTVTTVY